MDTIGLPDLDRTRKKQSKASRQQRATRTLHSFPHACLSFLHFLPPAQPCPSCLLQPAQQMQQRAPLGGWMPSKKREMGGSTDRLNTRWLGWFGRQCGTCVAPHDERRFFPPPPLPLSPLSALKDHHHLGRADMKPLALSNQLLLASASLRCRSSTASGLCSSKPGGWREKGGIWVCV